MLSKETEDYSIKFSALEVSLGVKAKKGKMKKKLCLVILIEFKK